MIVFKVKEEKVLIDGCKYYAHRMFAEQQTDGSYIRPTIFLNEHRLEMVKCDIEGIPKTMTVKYIGQGIAAKAVRISGVNFPYGEWVTVPIDFDSRDRKRQDLFLILGFKFAYPGIIKEKLNECQDGDRIMILRKWGGMGDIIMQSMLFPEIRRQFPNSEITFALPMKFMPLYENCRDIDYLRDADEVTAKLYKIMLRKEYDFIGDISTSCAQYESRALDKKGFVDRERTDIWAESIGINLKEYKTCIRLKSEEISKAREIIRPDHRKIIGLAPFAAAGDRSYPCGYIQPLINAIAGEGYRVFLFHSGKLNYENCEMICDPDLRILGAVIRHLDLMISVDTGPMHYAGILGIPIVALFGVTDSKVRLNYYRAIAIQGECRKKGLPCWGRDSASCKQVYSQGNVSRTRVKIASDMASCMFIEPERIMEKIKEIYGRGICSSKPVQTEATAG